MAVDIYIWRAERGTQNYRMQLDLTEDEVKASVMKRVLKTFKDWDTVGEGSSSRANKKRIFLFKKSFVDEDEKKLWAKTVGYVVKEINSRGREIIISPKRRKRK
tara:strand:+ start:354 stop:665 length:312 start_codon:yes stop_codon:yes gene_type:complete